MSYSPCCPNCTHSNSVVYDYIQGIKVCSHCGLVISDVLIQAHPDSTVLTPGQLYSDRGFSLDGLKYKSSAASTDKVLHKGLLKLKNTAFMLNISDDILNCSLAIFKEAKEKTRTKIARIRPMVAASLFIASKKCRTPFNIKRIEQYLCVKRKIMTKTIKHILQLISLRLECSTQDYVKSLGNNLHLSIPIITDSCTIFKNIQQSGLLGGKNPFTIASVSILYCCKLHQHQIRAENIALYAKVSAPTITRAYNFLVKQKEAATLSQQH